MRSLNSTASIHVTPVPSVNKLYSLADVRNSPGKLFLPSKEHAMRQWALLGLGRSDGGPTGQALVFGQGKNTVAIPEIASDNWDDYSYIEAPPGTTITQIWDVP